jgi:hypothetical protein
MATFNNLKSLFRHIEQKAKEALQQPESNVKDVVVHELKKSIEENVYSQDAYDKTKASAPYKRLREQGGLIDDDLFIANPTAKGVSIYSTRMGEDRNGNSVHIADIIEGYATYSTVDIWGYGFESPRHFVDPARQKLKNSRSLKKAFSLDMRNMGINVKMK